MYTKTWSRTLAIAFSTGAAVLITGLAAAQGSPATPEPGELLLPDFQSLDAQSTERTVVTLGPKMLHFASHFVGDRDANGAATKRLLATVNHITIRSYQFDHDNAYSTADVEAIRAQLKSPDWTRLVQVRSNTRENVDVFVAMDGDQTRGLAIVSAEPRELTVVNVVGNINPEDIQYLQGHLKEHTGRGAVAAAAPPPPPASPVL